MLTPTFIEHHLKTEQSLSEVWRWVGSGEGLSRWFTGEVYLEPVVGGRYEERGQYPHGEFILQGRVLQICEPLMLVLAIRLDMHELGRWPIYTPIEIKLWRTDELTHLKSLHKGFENLPERYREQAFKDFVEGWDGAFKRLRKLTNALED
ncbi:MAG: hypothetical protein CUN55_09425 [Phototrophicales bacterium]|nr:MAG: hypothetical protein CUN55_09425 [Phototrophicales bacterium]